MLAAYTHQGYRVLAIARKTLRSAVPTGPNLSAWRRHCESDLTFLGLVVLENKVKPESQPTIGLLKAAHIRTVMVTGDNPLTAVRVAHDVQMITAGTAVFVSGWDAEQGGATWTCSSDATLQLVCLFTLFPLLNF